MDVALRASGGVLNAVDAVLGGKARNSFCVVRRTGEGAGKGTTMNCPFPAGSGRAEILGAFRDKLVHAANKF